MTVAQASAGVKLTVPEVTVAPGSTSYVVINFDLGAVAYTAYQFDIAYPAGISSVNGDDGNPAFQAGDIYSDHSLSSIRTAKGLDRFQCFSVNSTPFKAYSGTLLVLPIKAEKSLALGTYQATISPIEFVQTDATPDRPEAVTFNITVSKNVVLDESSTIAPVTATGVNVTVLRTIKAGEWSSICLPFALTESQVKAAFGNDVQLGDFYGYETNENSGGDIVGITVNFKSVTAMAANHPYVIKVMDDVNQFTVEGVDIVPVDKPVVAAMKRTNRKWSEMIGIYVANTILEENTLFLSGSKFWYSAGKTRMKAFRAYFDFFDVITVFEESYAKMVMNIDGVATEIRGISYEGRSDVSCAGTVYNLAGQSVNNTKKGVYVVGGRKVAVK